MIPIYVAFAASGVAGLLYEVLWARYLALLVGHSAYAQVLVLVVYLGGMAVGALSVGDLARRIRRPWLGYVGVEAALAVVGITFHPLFLRAQSWAYGSLFPSLETAPRIAAAAWGLAALLILAPSVLLGATFPLMAAGLAQREKARPGWAVATAYLVNTLGGAAGVLLGGFWLLGWVGLPGSMAAAALCNASAALLVFLFRERGADAPPRDAPVPTASAAPASPGFDGLRAPLLAVAFATALASFFYEVGWIRMLTLVLGGATHAFELMLSAFLLGLGLGGYLARNVLDGARAPLRFLGTVQWLMGGAALASLLLYAATFSVMAYLVRALSGEQGGYLAMNVARYGIAGALMVPTTLLAGMVLPALIAVLIRTRDGTAMIGWTYGVNTLGSVCGVLLAGLVLLPLVGLKGLILAGAGVDLLLGVGLLWMARREGTGGGRPALAALAAGGVLLAGAGLGVRLDRAVLTSGVFRYGFVPDRGDRRVLFYRDGRTSTVGVHLLSDPGLVVLTTNGKPDGSLGPRWFDPERGALPLTPIPEGRDATTQMLAPLLALAHARDRERVANIGHGTGMTGESFLADARVGELVTVEIEPVVIEASARFYPVNARVFEDPRSLFVIEDARAFLGNGAPPFDLIFSEPSNPWVSGNASLFTREFYARVREALTPGGILAQWVQLYEIDDGLVLSILAALDAEFPRYRGYLVGDADLLLVASADAPLPAPDASVLLRPEVTDGLLAGVPPFRTEHLEALYLFDEETLAPLLRPADRKAPPVPVNSDFHPVVDLEAEAARFQAKRASGIYSLGVNRLDLWRTYQGVRRLPPDSFALPPARGLEPLVLRERSAWLRRARLEGEAGAEGIPPPPAFPEWEALLEEVRDFLDGLETRNEAPEAWQAWAQRFEKVEQELHWTTAGWADEEFYGQVFSFLARTDAPAPVRAAVHLRHGMATWDFSEAAEAADLLLEEADEGRWWARPTALLDASVLTYLKTGRPDRARRAFRALAGRVGREADNLRTLLLQAWIREAS
ncbi:MAG: fused MFS/spermidine synthase [Gemmatimonadota bacterium]